MSHQQRPASCVMEISHNAVQGLVQYWCAGLTPGSDGKITRTDNSSSCSQTLLCPPSFVSRRLGVKLTLQPAAAEQRITSSLVSGFLGFSFLPRSCACVTTAGSVTLYYNWVIRTSVRTKINAAPYFSSA